MEDVEMIESNPIDDANDSKKKRIEFYKTVLKYYRARCLSLNIIVGSKQQTTPIPDDMKTRTMLLKNTKDLHDGTMMLESIKEGVNIFKNTLTCSQIISSEDFRFKREILDKIQGIIYFSKSIMKLYNEKISELKIIEKKEAYSKALDDYYKHLEAQKSNKNDFNEEESGAMEKAELQIYKINLIRAIKGALFGYASVHHPQIISKFENIICPLERNLVMNDFVETWNVGLPS